MFIDVVLQVIVKNILLKARSCHSTDNSLIFLMRLSGKMILKVKSFTRTVNLTHVLICCIGSKKFFIRNKLSDNDGRILILDVDIDDENFILINLYNPTKPITPNEAEQLKTLSKLTEMLTKLHLTQNNNIICAGDFNLFFNVKLECY